MTTNKLEQVIAEVLYPMPYDGEIRARAIPIIAAALASAPAGETVGYLITWNDGSRGIGFDPCHEDDGTCQPLGVITPAADSIGFLTFSPDDRFYHANDKTWWKKGDGGKLVRAEPPAADASEGKLREIAAALNCEVSVPAILSAIERFGLHVRDAALRRLATIAQPGDAAVAENWRQQFLRVSRENAKLRASLHGDAGMVPAYVTREHFDVYERAFAKCANDPDDDLSPKWRALQTVFDMLRKAAPPQPESIPSIGREHG